MSCVTYYCYGCFYSSVVEFMTCPKCGSYSWRDVDEDFKDDADDEEETIEDDI